MINKEEIEKINNYMRERGYIENSSLLKDNKVISMTYIDKDLRDYIPICVVYLDDCGNHEFQFSDCINPGGLDISTGRAGPLFNIEHFEKMKTFITNAILVLKDEGFRV